MPESPQGPLPESNRSSGPGSTHASGPGSTHASGSASTHESDSASDSASAPASIPASTPGSTPGSTSKVLVIGHGMVGSRFVEELVDRDLHGAFDVIVLGAEEYEPYNRVLLSDLVAGKVAMAAMTLPSPDRIDRRPVTVHRGARALRIDRARRRVLASDGTEHHYDVLVLATGAAARIPDFAISPSSPAEASPTQANPTQANPTPVSPTPVSPTPVSPTPDTTPSVRDNVDMAASVTAQSTTPSVRVSVADTHRDTVDTERAMPRGVHVLRSLDDAREIVAATLNSQRAVVVGGGVLGLEVATGLARRGLPVSVVHFADALMERQLDVSASAVLSAQLASLGIESLISADTRALTTHAGRVCSLTLADGREIPADLVVLSCGTIAESGLAAGAGLPVQRGIVVGADLASPADERIHAIGDCAQPPEGGTGLIATGWDQARRLAAMLASRYARPAATPAPASTSRDGGAATPSAPASTAASPKAGRAPSRTPAPAPGPTADPTTDVVRVKGSGLDVVTMGLSAAISPAPDDRVLRLTDPRARRLVEVVVRDNRVVGATCIGAGQVAADLTVAYTRGTPVPADPALLLLRPVGMASTSSTASPMKMPSSFPVCRCNGVTKGDIVTCFSAGARSIPDIAAATRATTGCGGCTDVVGGILEWLRSSDPDGATPASTQPASTQAALSQAGPPSRDPDVPRRKHKPQPTETSAV